MKYRPHDYQKYTTEFILTHPQSAIFLDCGLGKTVITLTALYYLLFDSFEIRKVLVICPLRVGAVWVEEINKWQHLNILRLAVAIGTPSSNGLMDLWAEFRLLDMGHRLGRFIGRYREDYFVPDKRNQQIVFSYKPKSGAEDAIYRRISDITISMKNTDYLKLPELVMNEVTVKLSEKEVDYYKTLQQELVLPLKGKEIDAVNAAALSGKLLQMANGAVYDEDGAVVQIHDRKLDALEDLIEAANGKPVLVAYWFKHDLQRILERFPAEKLDSAESIKRWNAGEIPVAVIHPASAGHGLNLQAGGSTLIWFGLTWSLELYQQTNARLWRQGQKNTVVIHHIITQNTIDEDVMSALKRKDKTQTALIEAVKARIYQEVE